MAKPPATPLVQAKGISEVRLLRRRPRYVVQGIPIEVAGMPFAITYATIGIHMLTLLFSAKWYAPRTGHACAAMSANASCTSVTHGSCAAACLSSCIGCRHVHSVQP